MGIQDTIRAAAFNRQRLDRLAATLEAIGAASASDDLGTARVAEWFLEGAGAGSAQLERELRQLNLYAQAYLGGAFSTAELKERGLDPDDPGLAAGIIGLDPMEGVEESRLFPIFQLNHITEGPDVGHIIVIPLAAEISRRRGTTRALKHTV